MLDRHARLLPARLAGLAGVLATTLLVACSGGTNNAPVIDKLDMPDVALQTNDKAVCGTAATCYVLSGTVGYHDDDGTVKLLRVYVPLSKPEPIVATAIPGEARGEHPLQLSFSGVPAGTKIDYEVAVVDSEGLESVHSKKSVVLP
jgi:hypothetical protein